jgi:hypothetical protein
MVVRIMRAVLAASVTLVWLAFAVPAAACSCVGFTSFDEVADAQHIVVAGTAEARIGDTLTIAVERWLWGPQPVQRLVVTEPSEQDMCAMGPNAPLGHRWLWVAWIGDVRPVVNQCQPSWSLADPEGATRLTQAIARFGGIEIPAPGAPVPESPDSGASLWFLVGGVGVVAIVLFGGAVVLSARRGRG